MLPQSPLARDHGQMSEPPPRSQGEKIARRAGIVASGTLLSRILGAVRDAIIAATFSRGSTDAFWLAFTIPNALRVLLGEGAVSGAFIPVFTEVDEKQGRDRARLFYARLAGAMLLLLFGVALLGVITAHWWVRAYAPGFARDPEIFQTTVNLTRTLFPYIFLMGGAALSTGALYAMKHFVAPAYAPVMLNVCLITAALGLAPWMLGNGLDPIGALAIGALVGGTLQWAVQWPALKHRGLLVWPRLPKSDPDVRRVFRLMLPLLVGLGIYQLNVLLSRQFASYLPTGSISYLYYGQRLVEIPQGMFALAIASASLPSLSRAVAQDCADEAKELFQKGLKLSLFVAIPSAVALAILAKPAAAVFFGRGEFDAYAVDQTSRSLFWQATGIWAVASVRTIVPMFHAYKDTRTPVIASAVNLVIFVALSLSLMGPMQHAGLALATSAAAVAQLAALLWLLRRKNGPLGLQQVAKMAGKVLLASLMMGTNVVFVARVGQWDAGGNDLMNIAVFLLAVVTGAIVFFITARLLGIKELDDALAIVKRRRNKP